MRPSKELIEDIKVTRGELRRALEPYRRRLDQLHRELHDAEDRAERERLSFEEAQIWLNSLESAWLEGPINAKGKFRSSGDGEPGLENYDGDGLYWFALNEEDFIGAFLAGAVLRIETSKGGYTIESRA